MLEHRGSATRIGRITLWDIPEYDGVLMPFSVFGLLSARSTRRPGISLTEIRLRPLSGVSPRFTEMHRVAFDKTCCDASSVATMIWRGHRWG